MHVGHDGENWHADGYIIHELPSGFGIFKESDITHKEGKWG